MLLCQQFILKLKFFLNSIYKRVIYIYINNDILNLVAVDCSILKILYNYLYIQHFDHILYDRSL